MTLNKIKNTETCIICLEDLRNDSRIISNNCSCLTLAHNICADSYLQRFNTCPFCRKQLNNTVIIPVSNNIITIPVSNNIITNPVSNNTNTYVIVLLNLLLGIFYLNPIITIVIINYFQHIKLLETYNINKLENPDDNSLDSKYEFATTFLNFTIFMNIYNMLQSTYFSLIYFSNQNNIIIVKNYSNNNKIPNILFFTSKIITDIIFTIFVSKLAREELLGGTLNIIDCFGRLCGLIVGVIFIETSKLIYFKINNIRRRFFS